MLPDILKKWIYVDVLIWKAFERLVDYRVHQLKRLLPAQSVPFFLAPVFLDVVFPLWHLLQEQSTAFLCALLFG